MECCQGGPIAVYCSGCPELTEERMAQAFKCDRCKQFNDGNPYSDVVLALRSEDDEGEYSHRRNNEQRRDKQLCKSCHSDIAKEIDRVPSREQPTEKIKLA